MNGGAAMASASAAPGGTGASAGPGRLRELNELPGPRGLPLLGSLLSIDPPLVHRKVEEWAERYGPFFRLRLGRNELLVVADHAAMGAVLRDRPDGFRRTPRLAHLAIEMGLAPGVFGAEGDAWRRQRRIVMAGFDPRQIRAYFPSLVKVTQRLETRWRRAARTGASIDLQADLMRFTVDAIAGLAFGADINTLESDDDVIQRHLDRIFPALATRLLSLVPTWRIRKSRADRELDRSVAAVNVAIAGFIGAARARLQADPSLRERPGNLLEAMIVASDAESDAAMSDREVAGNVMTMLLAGEDTTANTLAWMIHLLHRNPATLARATAEARAVGSTRAWTPETLASLDYLDACANETMRLKPVAPSLVLQALRDTTIADIRVPAGTLVFGALRSDSLKDVHFVEASAFEPARWLEGAPSAPSATSPTRVSMPFGAGPRVCPGRHLATLEMKMALAMLLENFEIAALETPNGGEAEEHLAFTMAPVGLRMTLRERATT